MSPIHRPGPGSVSRRAFLRGGGAALLPALSGGCRGAGAAPAVRDWPCFRDPNRNGVLDERLTLRPEGPAKLWEVEVGYGNASMAIAAAASLPSTLKPRA